MSGQFVSVTSRAVTGMDAPQVLVEVHVTNGLPQFALVGLPEASVKESKDRVRSALISSGYQLPPKRITANLAPADLPKQGSRYDLALALGVLISTGQLTPDRDISNIEFYGELGLNGELRAVSGLMPSLISASQSNHLIIIPKANLSEAAVLQNEQIVGAENLLEVCAFLLNQQPLQVNTAPNAVMKACENDIADIQGQHQAKRLLELCASGGHSLLLVGPPGAGKSMLASRLLSILPPLSYNQAIEVSAISSLANQPVDTGNFYQRQLINPHHSATSAAMIGGGSGHLIKPGALSLAHHSVLFLDELPEFDRSVLEALREPLETQRVDIARVNHKASYPAKVQLVCAMNPSPSGYFADDALGRCNDTPEQIQRYLQKVSGPLLDRIDCHLEVLPVSFEQLQKNTDASAETSEQVRQRVEACQARQYQRQQKLNSDLSPTELKELISLDSQSVQLLQVAVDRLGLSARGYHRVLRVGLTLADMFEDELNQNHIAEALSYRSFDKRLRQ